MKKKFIESSLTFIKKGREVSELEEKKLRYGLEGFYNLTTKTIVIILLAIYLNILSEVILLTIAYSTLRLFGFGIHMKTSLQCWMVTLPLFIGGSLFIKYYSFPNLISYLIMIIGTIVFLLFAPADTPARPLIRRKKRIRAKILANLILLIFIILYFVTTNIIYKNIIIYAIILESISINPITYRLLSIPFNNYKCFEAR